MDGDDKNSIYAKALLHRNFGTRMKYPEITKAMNVVRQVVQGVCG